MADAPEPGKGLVRWRPRNGLTRGPFAAYGLVIALAATCAALAYAYVERPPLIDEAAAAAPPPPAIQSTTGSLKLPFRRPRPLDFRTLTLAERDDMVEVMPNGDRLP